MKMNNNEQIDPSHSDDDIIGKIFPWKEMSPEEFAARHWLGFGCFSTKHMVFKNVALERWAKRFEEIFHDLSLLEECRSMYLTEAEIKKQKKLMDKNSI